MAVRWLINGGDPNYLLSGVILQVVVTVRQRFGSCFSFVG